MKRAAIVQTIEQEKIIAIIRLTQKDNVPEILGQLVSGGIKILEITSNTPNYLRQIQLARKEFPKILIGAGTVTNITIARDAIRAGAQFIVTPNMNTDVILYAHTYDVPVLMGALTPTEICSAIANGADMIKLFPAKNVGIDYFKAIKGPLSEIKFFVVGGIDLENMEDWIAAGASGFGLGSVLTKKAKEENPSDTIENRVGKFLNIIKTAEWIS